jgi:hypothetical protein
MPGTGGNRPRPLAWAKRDRCREHVHRAPPRTCSSPRCGSTKSGCAGLTLYKAIHELQRLLATWAGACPTRHQALKPLHHNRSRLT